MPGIDAFTKLLLHCDGVDAATTFPDSSPSARTVTVVGAAQVDTAQSVFGGASGLFVSNDRLTVPDHADFDFGAGDFTLDFRVRFNAVSSTRVILGKSPVGVGSWLVYLTGGVLVFYASSNGSSWDLVNGATILTPSTNTWYHVAVVRNGTNIVRYADGTSAGSTGVSTTALADTSDIVTIGGLSGATGLDGWLDEVRISKGIARWTSNFTPPAAAYSSDLAPAVAMTLNLQPLILPR
jgi:hypothetical protein